MGERSQKNIFLLHNQQTRIGERNAPNKKTEKKLKSFFEYRHYRYFKIKSITFL